MPALTKNIAIALATFAMTGCASLVDRCLNKVRIDPPYQAGPEAERVHQRVTVVDLHADTLLWDRDLLEQSSFGHVDLPRLREGNVAIQVFGVVTKVPLFFKKGHGNTDRPDAITLLAMVQGWPKSTRGSPLARSVYQAEKLEERIRASAGALTLIASRQDLKTLLDARDRGEPVIGAMLGLEGAHALEGKVAHLDRLYDAGFRLLGLTHFFDNEMAGSAHGVERGGLTSLGRELVQQAQTRGMLGRSHRPRSPPTRGSTAIPDSRPCSATDTERPGRCTSSTTP